MAAFFYASQFICAYLDYKVYPTIGVESGLAYAIDTFLKYFLVFIGALISLQIVGFDLRALLVFAGAIGIGIGLAMQSLASNLISGFVIIFGGKIRKGDWVEVGDRLGEVTDIYLRATKVRTRDNIEYLIPNSELISTTIINYSLTTPMIRIRIPFGVSYSADPHDVERVVLEMAEKETSLVSYRKPEIRFTGYGDSSIDFELLVWMDIRKNARDFVISRLYFGMFDALKDAGIEIPFPQRDLHIRSGVPWEKMAKPQP
jgi:small-conductance mechanosensitive channel